jgi:hypothetical protein
MKKMMRCDLDRVGATASLLCALHCGLLPVLINFPLLTGLAILTASWIETMLVLLAVVVGLTSFCPSYRLHRRVYPQALFATGLAAMLLGRYLFDPTAEWMDAVMGGGGALFIVAGHLINRTLCRRCLRCATAWHKQ